MDMKVTPPDSWDARRLELESQVREIGYRLLQFLAQGKPAYHPDDDHPVMEQGYREAVQDQLIICGIYNESHDTDPVKAVRDLIDWHVAVALDPNVSDRALKLLNAVPPEWKGDDVEAF